MGAFRKWCLFPRPYKAALSLALSATLLGGSLYESQALPPSDKEITSTGLADIFTPKQPIPYELLGLNAFVNDRRFGSVKSQMNEVRNTLGIKRVRVLLHWNDSVQPTPRATPFFAFYDEIIRSLPRGSEALIILTGTPSWMNDSRNWIAGNPRKTFIELWAKRIAARYARQRRVTAYQIWNEPNNPSFSENQTLDVLTKPENYVELLALAHTALKAIAPTKGVINGATTAIAQNFPATLDYNRAMVSAGALSFTDAYAIHYYGKNAERVLFGGIADFLNSIPKPLWITESGAQGAGKQLDYAQRIFPFLKTQVPGISRVYIYQFTESSPATTTYGLRNLTPGLSVSDLYINLRERPR
jgi:hypothetical protein